ARPRQGDAGPPRLDDDDPPGDHREQQPDQRSAPARDDGPVRRHPPGARPLPRSPQGGGRGPGRHERHSARSAALMASAGTAAIVYSRAMTPRNRIKAHVRLKARDLVPHELNPRDHPDAQRDALQALYDEIGFARSLLGYEVHTPDGVRIKLIDGHLRASM